MVASISRVLLHLFLGLFIVHPAALSSAEASDETLVVRKRGDAFLGTISKGKWERLYDFTVLSIGKHDQSTRDRLSLKSDSTEGEMREAVASFFKQVYGTIKPGVINSVRIKDEKPLVAVLQYRHGDLDAFYMKRIDGEWYYFLD